MYSSESAEDSLFFDALVKASLSNTVKMEDLINLCYNYGLKHGEEIDKKLNKFNGENKKRSHQDVTSVSTVSSPLESKSTLESKSSLDNNELQEKNIKKIRENNFFTDSYYYRPDILKLLTENNGTSLKGVVKRSDLSHEEDDIFYNSSINSLPYHSYLTLFNRIIPLNHFKTEEDAARAHDLALIRAVGPSNLVDSVELNFPLAFYALEPLSSFTQYDLLLKNYLFGSEWKGLKPCDFSFLLTLDDQKANQINKESKEEKEISHDKELNSNNNTTTNNNKDREKENNEVNSFFFSSSSSSSNINNNYIKSTLYGNFSIVPTSSYFPPVNIYNFQENVIETNLHLLNTNINRVTNRIKSKNNHIEEPFTPLITCHSSIIGRRTKYFKKSLKNIGSLVSLILDKSSSLFEYFQIIEDEKFFIFDYLGDNLYILLRFNGEEILVNAKLIKNNENIEKKIIIEETQLDDNKKKITDESVAIENEDKNNNEKKINIILDNDQNETNIDENIKNYNKETEQDKSNIISIPSIGNLILHNKYSVFDNFALKRLFNIDPTIYHLEHGELKRNRIL